MLDRASTFAHPEIVDLLKKRFIPVAIDQACQRRQKDTEGDFYRRIAMQSPRNDFDRTTQGFYIVDASGLLLLYNNNRDPEKLLRLMRERLEGYSDEPPKAAAVASLDGKRTVDRRYGIAAPEGGLVVRVNAKVLDGYEPTSDRWREIFQSAVSRDNLWITAAEADSLSKLNFPDSLLKRICRFHLVDNTRGEPDMWKPSEIERADIVIDDQGKMSGRARLATRDGNRGYDAELRGELKVEDGKVAKFELVALGDHLGEGRYTRGAPKGRFPLAIALTLADGTDIADPLPPQGARGWLDGYLRSTR